MEPWAYEDVLAFAQSWGSVYFSAMFAIVVIYALWPKNLDKFTNAAQIPLSEDEQP
jgi:cytochrome c oxidase cbb3-type subunit 4